MTQPQDDIARVRRDASQKVEPSAQSLPMDTLLAQFTDSKHLLDLSENSSTKKQMINATKDDHTSQTPLPAHHMEVSSTGAENHHELPGTESSLEGRTSNSATDPSQHDTIQEQPTRRWSFGRRQSATSMDSIRVPNNGTHSNSTAFLQDMRSTSGSGLSSTSTSSSSKFNDHTTPPAAEGTSEVLQAPAEAATAAAEAVAAALQSGGCEELPRPGPSSQEIEVIRAADATSSSTHSTPPGQVTLQDHEQSQQQQGDEAGAAQQHRQSKRQQHHLPLPALIALGVAAAGAAAGLVFVLVRRFRQTCQAGDDNIIIDEEDAAFEAQIKAMEEEEKKAAAADAAAAAAHDTSAAMSAEEAELAVKQAEAAKKERILAAALAQEDAEMAKIDALHSDDLLELGEDELAELEAELAALEGT